MTQTTLDFLKVYLITNRAFLPEHQFLKGIESALEGGVKSIQLREKGLQKEEILVLAKAVVLLTRRYGAKLFINHYVDIAEASGADGVHLTETNALDSVQKDKSTSLDTKFSNVKAIKKQFPHLLVGISTHSLESARAAKMRGADFITFSPIFETPSKRAFGEPQGLGRLEEVTNSVDLPVIALGGIKLNNVSSVMARGAFGIALISGIWGSKNIKVTSHQFMTLIAGDIL